MNWYLFGVKNYLKSLPKKPLATWVTIARVSKSKFARSSWYWLIGVPIASKLIYYIDQILIWFETKILKVDPFLIQLTLPFSWKILYFVAVLLAIANALYRWRCPSLIRDYSSATVFIADGKTITDLGAYAQKYGERWAKKAIKDKSIMPNKEFPLEIDGKPYPLALYDLIVNEFNAVSQNAGVTESAPALQMAFSRLEIELSLLRVSWRMFIGLIYFLAALGILYLLYQNLTFVLATLS